MRADSDTDSDLAEDGDEGVVVQACDPLSLFHGPLHPLGPMFGILTSGMCGFGEDSDDDDPLEYVRWLSTLKLPRAVGTYEYVFVSTCIQRRFFGVRKQHSRE